MQTTKTTTNKKPVVQCSLDHKSYAQLTKLKEEQIRSESAMAAILIKAGLTALSQDSASAH